MSNDDCLEDKREDYQNCSLPHCVRQSCTVICTRAVFTLDCWFRFTPCWRLRINSNNLLSNVHILEAGSWCWQTNKSTSYCLQCFDIVGWALGRAFGDEVLAVRCKWFAYGPADASATLSSIVLLKSRMVYPFAAGLPRLIWKRSC